MVCSCDAPQKGTGPKSAKYAHGGAEVTTRSRFYKTPNPFREDNEITDYAKKGKGGTMSKLDSDPAKAVKSKA